MKKIITMVFNLTWLDTWPFECIDSRIYTDYKDNPWVMYSLN